MREEKIMTPEAARLLAAGIAIGAGALARPSASV